MEWEALAMARTLHKSRHLTLGNKKLTVLVDHKPLLKILDDREMAGIENPRNPKPKAEDPPLEVWRGSRARQGPPRGGRHVPLPSVETLRQHVLETVGTLQEMRLQASGGHGRADAGHKSGGVGGALLRPDGPQAEHHRTPQHPNRG